MNKRERDETRRSKKAEKEDRRSNLERQKAFDLEKKKLEKALSEPKQPCEEGINQQEGQKEQQQLYDTDADDCWQNYIRNYFKKRRSGIKS